MVKGVLWDNTRSFFLVVSFIITIVQLNILLLKMERTSSSVSSFSILEHLFALWLFNLITEGLIN